jgi:hypothetical protein
MGTSIFPTGTATLFQQTSAPTGWTKVTTYNDYALRIVSGSGGGTGGSVAFSSAFTAQTVSTTATVPAPGASGTQNPGALIGGSHGHVLNPAGPFSQTYNYTEPGAPTNVGNPGFLGVLITAGSTYKLGVNWDNTYGYSSTTGGDGSHTHPLTWTASTSVTWTPSTLNLAVQYVDVIICTIN